MVVVVVVVYDDEYTRRDPGGFDKEVKIVKVLFGPTDD